MMASHQPPNPEPEARTSEEWMRERAIANAQVAYITDVQRRDVREWWHDLVAHWMPFERFERRTVREGWSEKRNAYWNAVINELIETERRTQVQKQVAELQELASVRQALIELATPRIQDGTKIYPVKPASLEGLVNAVDALERCLQRKRTRAITEFESECRREQASIDVSTSPFGTMPEEDYREILRQIVIKKQQRYQAESVASETSDAVTKDTNGKD